MRAVAVATMLAVLSIAAPAGAATLSTDPYNGSETVSLLTYTAASGEHNRLVVSEDAEAVTFTDPGAVIGSDGSCEIGTGSVVRCRKDRLRRPLFLDVRLGDGDDTARADILSGGAFGSSEETWLPTIRMFGGPGADELTGADLADEPRNGDLLHGGAGVDRLSGRAGSDSLEGGAEGDVLDGGSGSDWFQGRGNDAVTGADADTFLGGEGAADRVDYMSYRLENTDGDGWRGIFDDLHLSGDGEANDGAAGEHDNIGADVEGADLGNGDDFFQQGAGALRNVHGGGGDDELRAGPAGGGNLQGGGGNDVLVGGDGDDNLSGHDGNDRIVGGPGPDALFGDEGDDWIDARDPPPVPGNRWGPDQGHDWMQCGQGNDEVYVDETERRAIAAWDGCELIHAPEGAAWPPPTAVPPVAIASAGTATQRTVRLKVRCGDDATACSGTLVLRTSKSKKTLARGAVTGKKDRARTVAVPLTTTGRAMLRRAKRIETRDAEAEVEGRRCVQRERGPQAPLRARRTVATNDQRVAKTEESNDAGSVACR